MYHCSIFFEPVQIIPYKAPYSAHTSECFGSVKSDRLALTQVCQSYIYIVDEILLPTRNNSLSSVPAVNTTFLQSLIGAGSNAAPSTGASGVGTITDPVHLSTLIWRLLLQLKVQVPCATVKLVV